MRVSPILPYGYVVGQERLRRALEIAFVAPGVGGVLVSGERGTAKSTTVRAFAWMVYGELPVTLPINATDDRVLGGWSIEALMRGRTEPQAGLLERAGEKGMLYVDEVNLLDDHLVNVILDVASTGLLVVQREHIDEPGRTVSFTLVGTMNPEEGGLRPQLLDRFGLLVPVEAEMDVARRREILLTVLRYDEERERADSEWLRRGFRLDAERRGELVAAREAARKVELPGDVAELCARVSSGFGVAGHRSEIVMALGARACAALAGRPAATAVDVREVAPYAVVHRRPEAAYGEAIVWTPKDQERLDRIVEG
ncbi:AAA family ATPase [Actinomadura vinacea]|uniref:AAA family ATPase n=1 Tax=Actinomadura vinacea TaxID=115336 RepID=A0ABN3J901_9ACTN